MKSKDEVLERYKLAIEESEGKKKQMKNEWKDDEAASRNGDWWRQGPIDEQLTY